MSSVTVGFKCNAGQKCTKFLFKAVSCLMLLLFTLRLTSLVSVAVTQAGLQESFGVSLVRRYWSSVRANQTARCSGMTLNLLGYVFMCMYNCTC